MAKPSPKDLQAMLQQYLDNQGGIYPSVPSIDPYIQDQQGDFFTTAKQAATLAADPSFLMINGALDPGAFDPIASYEAVEMPGRAKLNQWSTGNDFQKLVSGMLLSGTASTGSIMSELARMVSQPRNDTERNIVNLLPPAFRFDEITGEQKQQGIDFQGIRDEVQSLESAMNSDPQNTVTDPSTGLPSILTTEDSPMTLKARSLGYKNTPGEPYNGYDFAPEGVTPESDAYIDQAAFASRIPYATAQGIEGHSQGKYEGLLKQSQEAQKKWLDQERARHKAVAEARQYGGRPPIDPRYGAGQSVGPPMGGLNGSADDTEPAGPSTWSLPGTLGLNSPSTPQRSGPQRPGPQPQVRSQGTPLIPENPMTATPFDQYSSNPTDDSWAMPGTSQGGATFSTGTDPTSPSFDLPDLLGLNSVPTPQRSSPRQPAPQPQVRSQGTPLIPKDPMTATPFDQYSSNPTDNSWALPGASQGGATFSTGTDPTSFPFYDVSWDEPGEKHNPNRPGFPGADAMGRPNPMPGRPQVHSRGNIAQSLAQSLMRDVLAKKADQARFALSKDQHRANVARRQMTSAIIARDRAREAAGQRQAVANQLTSQGRTKFGDEVQMRLAYIYGMNQ